MSHDAAAPRARRLPDPPPGARLQASASGKTARPVADAYVEHRGETQLHLSTMVAWATQSGPDQSGWPAYRLSAARSFARHLQAIDPATEVPAADLLPRRYGRATPYLYSDDEVAELLRATAMLRGGHRVATYRTLISLLVATGMRVGEAIALDRDDIDAPECVLTIRHTKFGKSRELPVHASTIAALMQYLQRGDRPRTARSTDGGPRVRCRHPRAVLQCPVDVSSVGASGRPHVPIRDLSPADSRSAAPLRGLRAARRLSDG